MSIVFEIGKCALVLSALALFGCEKTPSSGGRIGRDEAAALIEGHQSADSLIEAMKTNENWPSGANASPNGLQLESGTADLFVDGDIVESDLAGIGISVEHALSASDLNCVNVTVFYKEIGQTWVRRAEMSFRKK
jgi:hypothetical protein